MWHRRHNIKECGNSHAVILANASSIHRSSSQTPGFIFYNSEDSSHAFILANASSLRGSSYQTPGFVFYKSENINCPTTTCWRHLASSRCHQTISLYHAMCDHPHHGACGIILAIDIIFSCVRARPDHLNCYHWRELSTELLHCSCQESGPLSVSMHGSVDYSLAQTERPATSLVQTSVDLLSHVKSLHLTALLGHHSWHSCHILPDILQQHSTFGRQVLSTKFPFHFGQINWFLDIWIRSLFLNMNCGSYSNVIVGNYSNTTLIGVFWVKYSEKSLTVGVLLSKLALQQRTCHLWSSWFHSMLIVLLQMLPFLSRFCICVHGWWARCRGCHQGFGQHRVWKAAPSAVCWVGKGLWTYSICLVLSLISAESSGKVGQNWICKLIYEISNLHGFVVVEWSTTCGELTSQWVVWACQCYSTVMCVTCGVLSLILHYFLQHLQV